MAVTLTFAAPAAAQLNPAYDYATSDLEVLEAPFTLGFSFTLSQASSVNALGVWTPANLTSNQVAIWDINGQLLTSTTVNANDPTQGQYRYGSIAPLTLGAGQYVIGGQFDTGTTFPLWLAGVTSAPGYSWTGHREIAGSQLTFPVPQIGLGDQSAALVNFSFQQISAVPEPATWAMMLIGFGFVGMTLRRRRKNPALAPAA